MSESQTLQRRSDWKRIRHPFAALRTGPGERERGPGSKLICGDVDATTLGPGLRRDDDQSRAGTNVPAIGNGFVIPSLRSGRAPGERERGPGSKLICGDVA